jgi:UDP-N-acetylglucosamine 4,6-dehydratase
LNDQWVNGKAVLITGGTGSFGRKCVETLLRDYDVARLVVFSRDELKQEEMRTNYNLNDPRLRYFIGDIRDRDRLYRALSGIDAVIHTAALKQVPALEYNPMEAVKTNVQGSENLINAAIDRGVKRVIALSTDKAVNPINLYGATKLVAEKLFTQGNIYADPHATKLACTRYGNVIGSRGSVIPLFLRQKEKGVITVTDERMTRYWITLDEGVKFVLRCLNDMAGGEVFVPKLPSMRLGDLAKVIAPECRIDNIGIRAGEKLHEVLVSRNESPYAYELDDMFVIEPVIFFRKPEDWPWATARRMEPGTKYSSDTNPHWLSNEEIGSMIAQWRDGRAD